MIGLVNNNLKKE